MTATAKEVVEAIDVVVRYIGPHHGDFSDWAGLDTARIVLSQHRASLLEKGGPDAAVLRCEGCGEHIASGDCSIGHTRTEQDYRGDPVPVSCGPVRFVAPLEKGARFSDAELLVLRRTLRTLEGWRDTYTTATRDADAATLRRMLTDTPGGAE